MCLAYNPLSSRNSALMYNKWVLPDDVKSRVELARR